jgi:oligopeptide/dipeptide ABC transporter ATP-binding protein
MTRIYTRTGDDGETGLFGGGRVRKDDPRVDSYGEVDELNAVLGLARSLGLPAELAAWSSLPIGCSFHPRCRMAIDACRASLPPRIETAPGHHAECFRAQEVFDGR